MKKLKSEHARLANLREDNLEHPVLELLCLLLATLEDATVEVRLIDVGHLLHHHRAMLVVGRGVDSNYAPLLESFLHVTRIVNLQCLANIAQAEPLLAFILADANLSELLVVKNLNFVFHFSFRLAHRSGFLY